jgi:exodeoxyribonuclease VII large subunit
MFDSPSSGSPLRPSAPRLLTVSQLNALIRQVLGDNLPGTIHLVGEISNLNRHSSGHMYLTLKDDAGEIKAVMWKSSAASLKFKPTDGLEVVATGYVDVYAPRGQYQFYISRLEPRGVGALELAFRQLHDKLAREGLFDPARKRKIPHYPRVIGLVTSPTGAAIRDILHTIQRRYCCASVLLHPVRVQGDGAAAEIAAAIERLNRFADRLGGIDVMIVGRGGGSLEDLWAFNEEVVARAIHASRIPVISAVGHEVDVTISDLVADLRAPTPTAAAELACPVLDEVLDELAGYESRLRRAVRHRIEHARHDLAAIERLEWFRDPCGIIRRAEQQLDEMLSRLQYCSSRRLSRHREQLHAVHVRLAVHQPAVWLRIEAQALRQDLRHLAQLVGHSLELTRQSLKSFHARLEASSFQQTLVRGFTITRMKRGRQIVTHPDQVKPGDIVITQTHEGDFESRVEDSRQPRLFD